METIHQTMVVGKVMATKLRPFSYAILLRFHESWERLGFLKLGQSFPWPVRQGPKFFKGRVLVAGKGGFAPFLIVGPAWCSYYKGQPDNKEHAEPWVGPEGE